MLDTASPEASAPKHVVEENQPVLPNAWQEQFVIGIVFGFVGIDESKVEPEVAIQLLQGRNGGAEPQLNFVFNAGLRPVYAGDAGPFLTLVDAD